MNENGKPQLDFELEKVRGFFCADLFLDYIRYFVLFVVWSQVVNSTAKPCTNAVTVLQGAAS